MSDTTKIVIRSFHPLNVTLPDCDTLQGKVRIVLPDVHVKVVDLSMGGIIPNGPHLGADVPMVGVDVEFEEPVEIGKFMQFVVNSADVLEKAWKESQKVIDKHGAVLG